MVGGGSNVCCIMPAGCSIDRPTPASSPETASSASSLSMSIKQMSLSDIHARHQTGSKARKNQVERVTGAEKSTKQKFTSNRHEMKSESSYDPSCSDGFFTEKHGWTLGLRPTLDRHHLPSLVTHLNSATSEGDQSSKPTLTGIILQFTQEKTHERRSSWPNSKQVVNSDPKRKTPRRLRVNSIRASAHQDRNERKVRLRRAQTAQEVSIEGRSIRALYQITHEEAIAASELERKRQEWLQGEEKRKREERACLQSKVDQFIAKVENDKRKHRYGKSKMTTRKEGNDITKGE